jgi:hypothetical protein
MTSHRIQLTDQMIPVEHHLSENTRLHTHTLAFDKCSLLTGLLASIVHIYINCNFIGATHSYLTNCARQKESAHDLKLFLSFYPFLSVDSPPRLTSVVSASCRNSSATFSDMLYRRDLQRAS